MSKRGDLLLDDRPLVDHPDPFHQDEIRAHRDEVLAVVVDRVGRRELVATVAPAEDAEHDLRDLDRKRVAQVAGRDRAAAGEDVPEPLQGLLLHGERLVEPLARELALLDQHVAEPVLEAVRRGVGHHHHAVLERDGDDLVVLLVRQGQRPGLPLQTDQLEDVRQAEVADRAFEGHPLRPPARRLAGAGPAAASAARPPAPARGGSRRARRRRAGRRRRPAATAAIRPRRHVRRGTRRDATSSPTSAYHAPVSALPDERPSGVEVPRPGREDGQHAEDPLAPALRLLDLRQLAVARRAGDAVPHHEQVIALRAQAAGDCPRWQ